MTSGRTAATRVLVGIIRSYQLVISPTRLPSCRYTPTCSAYALVAVETHGAVRGGMLALRRLARCHPWHAGGHDPVPPHVLSVVDTPGPDTPGPQPARPVRVIGAPVSTLHPAQHPAQRPTQRLAPARRPAPRPRSRRPAV